MSTHAVDVIYHNVNEAMEYVHEDFYDRVMISEEYLSAKQGVQAEVRELLDDKHVITFAYVEDEDGTPLPDLTTEEALRAFLVAEQSDAEFNNPYYATINKAWAVLSELRNASLRQRGDRP